MPSNEELDLLAPATAPADGAPPPARPPGFRLERIELLNWGTFHGEVQVFDAACGWALLIGDNGSGKSTAIDALRTLLVPPRYLNYNDASGDGRRTGARDRTRRSYVRGAWASTSTADATAATPTFLREPGVLTAIAATFVDRHRGAEATLAQILWENGDQIREIYATAPGRRSLRDLLGTHTNTNDIRRAARRSGWLMEDSFAAYAERFRALLHIPGEKALEVFNRAIGMKEVGDIDAFVRQFMLPAADTYPFIRDTLQPHYRTLLDCWSAIERAEKQVGLLRPIAEAAARIESGESRIEGWHRLQEFARPWFAHLHLALLREQETEIAARLASEESARAQVSEALSARRTERDVVQTAIASSDAGARLQALRRDLEQAEQSLQRSMNRRALLDHPVALLGAAPALASAQTFIAARAVWETLAQNESHAAAKAEETRAERLHDQRLALNVRQDRLEELQSVERHRVNIPRDFLDVRARVAAAVGAPPEQIPFAGELMEVRDEHAAWTGAIERLLRGFGLSLLVPESFYRRAAEYINSTGLRLRLVFHRVPATPVAAPALSSDRVAGRLEFRTEHPLHLWVASELVRRFNHRCCESVAELETVDFGITREGLVRDRTRHIKDDSRALDDPGARILGWSTERKLAALRRQIAEQEQLARVAAESATSQGRLAAAARERADAARALLAVADFAEIDPARWQVEILRLRTEREDLERSSDQLRTLQGRLRELDDTIAAADRELQALLAAISRLAEKLDACRRRVLARTAQIRERPDFDAAAVADAFAEIAADLPPLNLDNADELAQRAHASLQGRVSNEQRKVNEATQRLVAGQSDFLREFPEFRQTLDTGSQYAPSYAATLARIERDDLPKHRERFEHYLSENLVGDLLMLERRLGDHQEALEERIAEINQALAGIDYSDTTFVQLRLAQRPSAEVAEFRRRLKSCFEHGIAPAPEERARVFERVRALLEQFQRDPEATQRVTDVRQWFTAAVRELRRADGVEVNYYAATTGKSGGQKARLAFTILASALAAQYGLSTAAGDAPNFRLVVIDEAFSRTDESNSTRAMELFARLGFQLIIVGPFDAKAKLAIPFVQTIHLAANPAGNSSRLVSLARDQLEAAATPIAP